MKEVQKKHHVIMQQYTSMARKQLRFQTMVMVVVIDNMYGMRMVSDFKKLMNGVLQSLVNQHGNTMVKLTLLI